MTWNRRVFPYPLLANWTGDYPEGSFTLTAHRAAIVNGQSLELDLSLRLESPCLQALVERGDARYAVEVACPKTFAKETFPFTDPDKTLTLPAMDYAQEALLTPYIVSTQGLKAFASGEHADEWRMYNADGFDLPESAIIAVGDAVRVKIEDLSVNSVIDLVADPSVVDGEFWIDSDLDHIKIHVSESDKTKIEAIRVRRAARGADYMALFPSLYLNAVSEGLRSMGANRGRRWEFAFRNALERIGAENIDADTLADDSLKYAQAILGRPLSGFLNAAFDTDEEAE